MYEEMSVALKPKFAFTYVLHSFFFNADFLETAFALFLTMPYIRACTSEKVIMLS